MVMARGLARPWVCGAASSPPRATARVRVGGAVSILAHRRGGGAAHALPLPEGGRHRLRPAVYEVDLHRSEQWDLLPAGGGGEDGGGYFCRRSVICAGGGKQVGVRPCVGKEARDGDLAAAMGASTSKGMGRQGVR